MGFALVMQDYSMQRLHAVVPVEYCGALLCNTTLGGASEGLDALLMLNIKVSGLFGSMKVILSDFASNITAQCGMQTCHANETSNAGNNMLCGAADWANAMEMLMLEVSGICVGKAVSFADSASGIITCGGMLCAFYMCGAWSCYTMLC